MIFFHYILAIITWIIMLVLRLVMVLSGVIMTAIAIPFRKEYPSDRAHSWVDWKLIDLPRWAYLWGNRHDGCLGDIRGQYAHNQSPEWMRKYPSILAYYWLAFRNPANNFSRFTPILACDMSKAICVTLRGQDLVKDKTGLEGYQFVRAQDPKGIPYYGLYFVSKFRIFGKALRIRIGYKVSVANNNYVESDSAWKSFDFSFSLKDMD